ncbi:hypothetical protein JCM8202_000979 [Rhodotorula sphaerocarpa]
MFRAAARSTFRSSSRQAFARRAYNTSQHTSAMPNKSDMPWVIGSALVFIPLFFSLTSPPGMHAQTHAISPAKEGTHEEVPAARKATGEEDPAEKESNPTQAAEAQTAKEEGTKEETNASNFDGEKPKNVSHVAEKSQQATASQPGEGSTAGQEAKPEEVPSGPSADAEKEEKKDEGEGEKKDESN